MNRVLLFFILICYLPVSSQTNWQLVKNKNGIKVFTADHKEAKVKLVKVEAYFPGNVEKLASILLDPSQAKKWAYSTKECYLIKRNSSNEIITYMSTSFPWPANDRDVVMKTTLERRSKTLLVTCSDVVNLLPEIKGMVRISTFKNTWEAEGDDNGFLKINYLLQVNPGGSLPAWIINLFISKGPYETFFGLSQLLKK